MAAAMTPRSTWDGLDRLEGLHTIDPEKAMEMFIAFVRDLHARGLWASQRDRTHGGLTYPSPFFLFCENHPHREAAWLALHEFAAGIMAAAPR